MNSKVVSPTPGMQIIEIVLTVIFWPFGMIARGIYHLFGYTAVAAEKQYLVYQNQINLGTVIIEGRWLAAHDAQDHLMVVGEDRANYLTKKFPWSKPRSISKDDPRIVEIYTQKETHFQRAK